MNEFINNEEIEELFLTTEYIEWLYNYEDYLTTNPKMLSNITKEEKESILKLKPFYKGIETYAHNNNIKPNYYGYGSYHKIKYNDKAFKIGIYIGNEADYFCKKDNNLNNCIDFNNILLKSKSKKLTKK